MTGTSLSRNYLFNRRGTDKVRLVLDARRLSQAYRVVPVNDERTYYISDKVKRGQDLASARDDADWTFPTRMRLKQVERGANASEEFVIGDVKPLHRYLVRIQILRTPRPSDRPLEGIDLSLAERLRDYRDQFHVQIDAFDPEMAYHRQKA
jgi:hypothetical protein